MIFLTTCPPRFRAATNENPSDWISICCIRLRLTRSALYHFGRAFVTWLREGKNIIIELRFAEGKFDRVPALATELVHLKVDIIVSTASTVTRDTKAVTSTIPIVMTNDNDPVANGFVASLARPGGNITGLSTLSPEFSGKRLELLKEIVLKLSHVRSSHLRPNRQRSKC